MNLIINRKALKVKRGPHLFYNMMKYPQQAADYLKKMSSYLPSFPLAGNLSDRMMDTLYQDTGNYKLKSE